MYLTSLGINHFGCSVQSLFWLYTKHCKQLCAWQNCVWLVDGMVQVCVCVQAGMPGSIPVYHRNHHQSQTEHPQKWLSVGGGGEEARKTQRVGGGGEKREILYTGTGIFGPRRRPRTNIIMLLFSGI